MKKNEFTRTELLIGKNNLISLSNKNILVFGIGGVGSFSVEALVRSGIGNLILVDNDNIDITNINRQIHSTHKTIGLNKVDVMKERVLSINPTCNVTTHKVFVSKENLSTFFTTPIHYVIDAIDTVTSKLDIIEYCYKNNIPLITCLGTGNKLDPTKFEVADINKTSYCPLAKVIRKELKNRNIKKAKVLFSTEVPKKNTNNKSPNEKLCRPIVGSVSFVPPVAGMILTSVVINELIKE